MDSDITLTLSPDRALLVLAALHVFGWLTTGDKEDDPDTPLTAETFEAYLSLHRQMEVSPEAIGALAGQLERDMLMIIHRNYTRTKEGFVHK
jgi:hypothetical protein